jgi:hypothetical protein
MLRPETDAAGGRLGRKRHRKIRKPEYQNENSENQRSDKNFSLAI